MSRFTPFAASIALALWCASLCHGIEMPKRPVGGAKPPSPKLSPDSFGKLRAPVPREAVVGALLANPTTKSALTDAASKQGISAEGIAALGKTPLGSLTQSGLRRAPAAAPSGDAELRNLDWSGGFTFTPFSVPTYGSGQWKLGALEVSHVRTATWIGDTVILEDLANKRVTGLITLTIELPEDELGLYAITIRLVNKQNGQCSAAWV